MLLQGLSTLIGEFLWARSSPLQGVSDGPVALFRPGIVGDLDFRCRLGLAHLRRLLGLSVVSHLETAGRSFRHFVQRLEHYVAFETLRGCGLQVECGQLQKADRLLELRGHRQLPTQPELQRRFEHRD